MIKYTPGPWYALKDNESSPAGHLVRSEPSKIEVARASNIYMDRSERLANARLIAAAPELLEALEALSEAFEYSSKMGRTGFGIVFKQADAAIAKARGRA